MNGPWSTQPRPIESSRLLLGEGVEEVNFFKALLKHLEITEVQVESYQGKSRLRDFLIALRLRTGFPRLEKLCITRDADNDPEAALASVQSAVQVASFPTNLDVAIFVLPKARQTGALEDLCLESIRGHPIEKCIDEYLKCAEGVFGSPRKNSKSRIHAWLAAQEPPDLRLGEAAAKGLVNWTSTSFEELKEFLKRLA